MPGNTKAVWVFKRVSQAPGAMLRDLHTHPQPVHFPLGQPPLLGCKCGAVFHSFVAPFYTPASLLYPAQWSPKRASGPLATHPAVAMVMVGLFPCGIRLIARALLSLVHRWDPSCGLPSKLPHCLIFELTFIFFSRPTHPNAQKWKQSLIFFLLDLWQGKYFLYFFLQKNCPRRERSFCTHRHKFHVKCCMLRTHIFTAGARTVATPAHLGERGSMGHY